MKKQRDLHWAVVEQVDDENGDVAFRAFCLASHVTCDAWSWPDGVSEELAAEAAVRYLGWREIHDPDGEGFCDAEHVLG